MSVRRKEAWITGIGFVSSLGEGLDAHGQCLGPSTDCAIVVDEESFAPYPVHPLAAFDFAKMIPRTSDQRQMGRWQLIGVYAAGLALADAGILGQNSLLNKIDIVVAAGNGERDIVLDTRILEAVSRSGGPAGGLNQQLMSGLRPTHYLGQLSNLLAGNISIVHKATGSSRTFKGEEMAGVAALEEAVCRLAAGQSQLMLVGAALNAERQDLLLSLELGGALLLGSYRPVSARADVGGGMIPGSVGVFLVIETPEHARARGAGAYASIGALVCDRSRRKPGDAEMAGRTLMRSLRPLIDSGSPLGILSGASGVEPITCEEGEFLHDLARSACTLTPRTYGSSLGHGIEAHFLSGVALAALAHAKGTLIERSDGNSSERDGPPSCRQILVTGFGHWRGEALGLVDAIPEGSSWAK